MIADLYAERLNSNEVSCPYGNILSKPRQTKESYQVNGQICVPAPRNSRKKLSLKA